MVKECYIETDILFDHGPLREYGLDPAALTANPTNIDTSKPANDSSPHIVEHESAHHKLGDDVKRKFKAAFALHKNDREDAIAKVFDQLALAKFWWCLELIPLLHTYQQEDGTWMRRRS